MTKFFYYLSESKDSGYPRRVFYDIVEAYDKKAAKTKIENDFSIIVKEKISSKKANPTDYRIFITELTPYWEEHWLTVRSCKECSLSYTLLQDRQLDGSANQEYCSSKCKYVSEPRYVPLEAPGIHPPVIYKITNKVSGRCYVGQTTQAFTLRWYQHFFSPGDTKFHMEIKNTQLTDWAFEVLEVLPKMSSSSEINQREKYFIDLFDSKENGLNTANFKDKAA